ncbi:MAG TPA: MOSC domain-containing protein [Saprospiraceae bacterium]|nr:MOSC domain-containing protein [Saprospiraceae bacterium]
MMDKKDLLNSLPQRGSVSWMGLRPKKDVDLVAVDEAVLDPETGLVGDHYRGRSKKRQVTLIQAEHLGVVGQLLGREISPGLTRRNVVVAGINLLALKDRQFQIGEVILEGTGYCHPCSKMERNLGEGGYNAMRGHGGLTAKIVKGGTIQLGDEVSLVK